MGGNHNTAQHSSRPFGYRIPQEDGNISYIYGIGALRSEIRQSQISLHSEETPILFSRESGWFTMVVITRRFDNNISPTNESRITLIRPNPVEGAHF